MANLPVSLNSYVYGLTVFAELGLDIDDFLRPVLVHCPLCRGGLLRIFADHVDGGEWFSCAKCGQNGDLIELCERVWKLDAYQTVARLARLGHPIPADQDAVNAYLNHNRGLRNRTAEVWNAAKSNLLRPRWWYTPPLTECSFPASVPADRFLEGPGGSLGIIDKCDVERCFSPQIMRQAAGAGHRTNPSAHAVFRGAGWHEVIVIPHWDLPGRISGFSLMGRSGDQWEDQVFKVVARGSRGNQHVSAILEAGLAMHPRTLQAAGRCKNVIVAMDDPYVAAGLQVRQFELSRFPLPLVAWHDSIDYRRASDTHTRVRTGHAWTMLGDREIVFWMPEFRAATYAQAIRLNARISTVGPERLTGTSLREYLRRNTPTDWWQRVVRTAEPWQTILGKWLNGREPLYAEELYHLLQLAGVDAEQAFLQADGASGERILAGLAKTGPRTAQLGRWLLSERGGGWYARDLRRDVESLICEAIVRIDDVVKFKREDCIYARGRILLQDQVIPFVEKLDVIERAGMAWLRKQCLPHGATLLRCDRKWERRLFDVATSFCRPPIAKSYERLGWSDEDSEFVLPGRAMSCIRERRELDNLRFLGSANRKVPPPLPGLCPTLIQEVAADNPTNRLFWAVATAVFANVLAKTRNYPTVGVALVGAGAQRVGRDVAAALSCGCLPVQSIADVKRCHEEEAAHDWPVYVERAARLGRAAREALWKGVAGQARNLIIAADWAEAQALRASGQWMLIAGDEAQALTDQQRDLAADLIPEYLEGLCRRQLEFRWGIGRACRVVSTSLKEWADAVRGDLGRVASAYWRAPVDALCAAGSCLAGVDPADGLRALLLDHLQSGRLRLIEYGSAAGVGRPALVREPGGVVFLAYRDLSVLANRLGVPVPSREVMAVALPSQDCFMEAECDGVAMAEDWLFAGESRDILGKGRSSAA